MSNWAIIGAGFKAPIAGGVLTGVAFRAILDPRRIFGLRRFSLSKNAIIQTVRDELQHV